MAEQDFYYHWGTLIAPSENVRTLKSEKCMKAKNSRRATLLLLIIQSEPEQTIAIITVRDVPCCPQTQRRHGCTYPTGR